MANFSQHYIDIIICLQNDIFYEKKSIQIKLVKVFAQSDNTGIKICNHHHNVQFRL